MTFDKIVEIVKQQFAIHGSYNPLDDTVIYDSNDLDNIAENIANIIIKN